MRKVKKLFAVILAAALLFAITPVSAFAEEPAGKVWISFVDNGVRAAGEDIPNEYKTPLGVIFEPEEVDYYEGDTIADVTLAFFKDMGIGSNVNYGTGSFYLSSIYGFTNPVTQNQVSQQAPFGEFSAGSRSGWMITLNDWFINAGASDFTVSDGDLIVWQYTCKTGEDIGGGFSAAGGETTLQSLSAEGGTLSAQKTSAVSGITGEYDLVINGTTANVKLTPSADNKNFMVKEFLNAQVKTTDEAAGTFYKRTQQIPVKAGDKIYIGVGETEWPSMNNGQTPSWYIVNIRAMGDINGDGKINVTDAFYTLQYAVGNLPSSDIAWKFADVNGDKSVNVTDAFLVLQVAVGNLKQFPQ